MVLDFCRRIDSPDAMAYVQVTRGVGMRGHVYRFAGGTPSLWGLAGYARPDGQKLHGHHDGGYALIRDIKTINLLPAVIYTQRAEEAGCDETIRTAATCVTECAHSNVHILKDGALKTAPCDNLIRRDHPRAPHRLAAGRWAFRI